jgi:4-amino-4-deoxy-L-arabinose transferase-like glycosyltransferase
MNSIEKNSKISSENTIWLIAFGLLITLAAFLYLFHLGTPDFWTDEILSQLKYHTIADNLRQIARDVHPPLYFLLSWVWNSLWNSHTEAGFRSFAAIVGIGCVVLTVLLGKRLVNRNFGLLSGFVVALSPFFLQYSRMHRYYSLLAFWTLLALVFLFNIGNRDYWWGIRVGLANLGLIYTNYIGAIFIIGQAALLPLVFVRERQTWLKWLLGQLVVVIGFLPWMWVMTAQTARGNIAYEVKKGAAPFLSLATTKLKALIIKSAYSGYVFFIGETTFPWKWVITIPAILVVIFGLIMLFRKPGLSARNQRSLLGYSILVLVVVIILSEIYTRIFSFQSFALLPSRLIPLVPLLLIILTFSLYRMTNRTVGIILILIFITTEGYGVYHYFARDQYLNPKYNVPWRQVLSYVINHSSEKSFACTDESSYLYYNRILKGPPAYGVMDLPQGFHEVGEPGKPLTLWVICRYRGDTGIRVAYQELDTFCRENFPIILDTSFAAIDPQLGRFLGQATGEEAPEGILSVVQYQIPLGIIGFEGLDQVIRKFIETKSERKNILGWIKD